MEDKNFNSKVKTHYRMMEINGLMKEDPLLCENVRSRFTLFPILYNDIWEMYKKAEASFWTVEEIDLSEDLKHWKELTNNERYFISHVLAYFSSSDAIISENLSINFSTDFKCQEIRLFYGFQIAIEGIHSEMYGILIDTYIKDISEKDKLFNAITTIPCIKQKAEWAKKWMDSDCVSLPERLIAFSIVEGLFFSASFCAIFWLKKRGLMPGLCFSNELISRDEGLHFEFASLIYNKFENKISEERVKEILEEAVKIESEFASLSLPVELIGMNSLLMVKYIKFCADRLLISLGYNKLYNIDNPFDWMVSISLEGKTNFFEKQNSNYSKSGVGVEKDEQKFTLNADF